MINEFKIERNAYGGEIAIDIKGWHGRSTSAQRQELISSTGRCSSSSVTHDLNARNFFDRERAPFQDNDFGGTSAALSSGISCSSSGAMRETARDKARRCKACSPHLPSSRETSLTIPPAQGSSRPVPPSARPIRESAGTFSIPTTKLPFPGNVVPVSRISTFAQKYAPFLPAANALDRLSLGVNRLVNPPITSS